MPLVFAWAALRRHAIVVTCVALAAELRDALARSSTTLRRPPTGSASNPVVGVLADTSNHRRAHRADAPDHSHGHGVEAQAAEIGDPPLLGENVPLRHQVRVACIALLLAVSARIVNALELACNAVRRHPFSAGCTAFLLSLTASLLGVSVPLALAGWALASLTSLSAWRALEPLGLVWLGCRSPSHLERERLDPALGADRIEVLIFDAAEPWLGRGVRSLVLSRALLDLLEDRALAGLLAQATAQVRNASLPGEFVVWLGNVPLLGVWCLSRFLVQLGRLLAIAVGASLVLPLALWPGGFTRWAGRLFGAAIVGCLGATLVSSGVSAAGLGLLLAWAIVPGLRALLNWETRQAEFAADDATLDAGLGWELVEALETLAWAASVPPPPVPLGWLCHLCTPLTPRADRIWQKLAQP